VAWRNGTVMLGGPPEQTPPTGSPFTGTLGLP
jgi:hypothetical protein